MQRNICLVIFFIGFKIYAFSQVVFPGDIQNDILKLITLEHDFEDKPIVITPSILHQYELDSLKFLGWEELLNNVRPVGKKISVINPSMMASYNGKYARGYNDGAVWQGRGLNSSINFGFSASAGKWYFTFAPVLYYAQNKAYRIDAGPFDKNRYQYPFGRGIDWVLRYGDSSYSEFWWGQSEVRFVHNNFTMGLSTENFVWGPSTINPILMSNNASGFPHLDIGTATPVQTKIGDVEFKGYWGTLRESDYFDEDPSNDLRFITGWSFGIRPKFAKGLSIGLSRVLYSDIPNEGLNHKDILAAFSPEVVRRKNPISPKGQNDVYDQMMSLTLRWAYPEKGIEFYLEYAKNDFPGTLADLLELPDRSRGYNLGIIKVSNLKNGGKLLFNFEHTTLANNETIINTITPTYYIHSIVGQGYTNNGQIMGAAVGPGANADYLRLVYYRKKNILGFTYQRVRYNDDYVSKTFSFNPPHDLENMFDMSYSRKIKNFFLDIHVIATTRRNWYYDTNVFTFVNLQPTVKMTYLIP